MALGTSLASLLGAASPSNDFSLSSFSFPDIAINVGAGQTLAIFSHDTAIAAAPEPATLAPVGNGVVGPGLVRRKRG